MTLDLNHPKRSALQLALQWLLGACSVLVVTAFALNVYHEVAGSAEAKDRVLLKSSTSDFDFGPCYRHPKDEK
jgi:hypothetical protein